jgi:hypothetical protein
MNRDELAIGVTNILYKLYSDLKVEGKRAIFHPEIKDQIASKNCSPSTAERFATIVHERDSIINYVLTVSSNVGEYKGLEMEKNDHDKITVMISDENTIKLKILYEFPEERFKQAYEKIKTFLKENSNKEVIEEHEVREKPIEKICDFGILGTFPLDKVNFESNEEYSDEQINNKITEILNEYKKNIDNINKKVFIKIFNYCFYGVDGEYIWEDDHFTDSINDITYADKLPFNFNELSNDEKANILFKEEIDESDFENIENSRLKFFNLEKIKDHCKIYNVTINEEYKTITIEVYLLYNDATNLKYCYPLIEMNYANNFEIKNFDPSF